MQNTLTNLTMPKQGKMRQITSQDRQVPSGLFAQMIGQEPGKMVLIDPGETFTLAEISGAGQIVRIWMTTMNMPGQKTNFNHSGLLRFYWDGEDTPSVEVPFGAFFGVPWGKYTHYTAEPLSCTSGGYNCAFHMPFSDGCRIEAVNESNETWPGLFFQIQYLELDEQPSPLRFHAQWRQEYPTKSRVPYRILQAEGQGHFAGVHLFMQNATKWLDPQQMVARYKERNNILAAMFPNMMGMGILEGWERIYVDGEENPSVTGTGTEDYFNSGFYFSNGTYSAPHWGCTVRSYLESRCAAYRFHINDPVSFNESIIVDMDHGYTNQVNGDYHSVAYWYQTEPHAEFPALPAVSDRMPRPTRDNAMQFALFSSPLWIPAGLLGIKITRKLLRKFIGK